MHRPLRPAYLGLVGLVLTLSAASAQPDLAPKPAAPPGASDRMALATPRAPLSRITLPRLASLLGRDEPIRIVAFGSSSTQGAGASSPHTTYPALLEDDLEDRLQIDESSRRSLTVINRGIGGDDSEAMAKRLNTDVLAERPDLVIWQTGSNEPLRGTPVERFRQLTREGILAMRATGADVILMDQQWCAKLTGASNAQAYADALHAVADELGVPVIRRHAMMRDWVARGLMTPTQMIGPDGLHMTDAGYRQLAKSAAAEILKGAGLFPSSLAQN